MRTFFTARGTSLAYSGICCTGDLFACLCPYTLRMTVYDGKRMCVGSFDGGWRTPVNGIAFVPESANLLICEYKNKRITEITIAGELVRRMAVKHFPFRVDCGKTIFAAVVRSASSADYEKCFLSIHAYDTGDVIQTCRRLRSPAGLRVLPGEASVAVCDKETRSVFVVSVATGNVTQAIHLFLSFPMDVHVLAPDTFAIAYEDGVCVVRDGVDVEKVYMKDTPLWLTEGLTPGTMLVQPSDGDVYSVRIWSALRRRSQFVRVLVC